MVCVLRLCVCVCRMGSAIEVCPWLHCVCVLRWPVMLSRRQVYWSRVNVSKLLRAVETGRHWEAAAFLYVSTGDFDQGVRVMVKHSPVAYNSDKFLEIIQKVRGYAGGGGGGGGCRLV